MTVRAVFFDMGGTLETFWQTPGLRRKAIPDLKARLLSIGIDLGLNDNALCEVISSGHARYHKWSIASMEELPPLRVWTEFILPGYKFDSQVLAEAAEELMFFIESRFYERAFRLEVPVVLEAIQKQGYRMGLISNVCCRRLVPEHLEKYGIIHYFDPIVLSSEYGRRKPDPAIFHYAARLANVPTSECMYVGDRIARDIVGSRKAGYGMAIQIINPYDHGEDDHGAEPDAVIHAMDELLAILSKQAVTSRSGQPSEQSAGRIRALLFDAGDILYHRPSRGSEFKAFLEEVGLADQTIPEAKREELKDQAFHGKISQQDFRKEILRLYGITDPELVERGSRALEDDDNDIVFFPGVPETLHTLKDEGYLLGIITDTANPIHVKLSWFEMGGFGHVWDSIISSQELGFQKPAPEIYAAALRHLGLQASQVVFVGHDVDELEGARLAGMKTIAFNYGKEARADIYIKHFRDLLDVPLFSDGRKA